MTDRLLSSGQIPSIQDDDLLEPLAWLERLPERSLIAWLRNAIWIEVAVPVISPHTSDFATYLARLVESSATENLKIRFRGVLSDLLREWGRHDPARCLVQLLILSGHLRCVEAEGTIALIARERIERHSEEVDLRRRCLSTLSGLGCTAATVPLFLRYINDIEYAAVCYRALYRFDLLYASSQLPSLIGLYQKKDALDDLVAVVDFLFNRHVKSEERTYLLNQVFNRALWNLPPNQFPALYKILDDLGLRRDENGGCLILQEVHAGTPPSSGIEIPLAGLSLDRLSVITRDVYLGAPGRIGECIGEAV